MVEPTPPAQPATVRLRALVGGSVQAVGFRWWTCHQAARLGLVGWARNLDDGRVEVVAEGPQAACRQLLDALASGRTPGYVTTVSSRWDAAHGGLSGFVAR